MFKRKERKEQEEKRGVIVCEREPCERSVRVRSCVNVYVTSSQLRLVRGALFRSNPARKGNEPSHWPWQKEFWLTHERDGLRSRWMDGQAKKTTKGLAGYAHPSHIAA